MRALGYSVLALMAGTALASAQSLGGSGYVSGEVQFEYLSVGGSTGDLTRGDVTLGLEFGGISAGRLGAELGLKGYFSNEGSVSEYALFPTLWYDGGFGRISVGSPRSPMADLIALPKFGGSYITHSYTEMFFNYTEALQMFPGFGTYGIRYDATLGGFDLGVSLHHYVDIDENMVVAALARDYGAFDFALGIEADAANPSGNSNITATLGYDVGHWGTRLTLGRTSVGDGSGYAINVFLRPTDRLKLEATYANYEIWGVGAVYGVNAEYAVLDNAVLGAGYMTGDAFDDTVGLYFRWNLGD